MLLSLVRAPALPPQHADFGSQFHTPSNRCLRFGPRVTATPARLTPVLPARLWTDQTFTGRLIPAFLSHPASGSRTRPHAFTHGTSCPRAVRRVKTYNEERRRLARQNADREKHLTRRAGEIARELERLVDAIAKGIGDFDTIGPRMKALQHERDQVKAQLVAAAQVDQVVTLHPAAVSRYLADIKRLSDVAADAAALDEPELVATLRNLVEAIIVHAPAHSDEFTVEIRASLSELMMPGPLVKRTGSGGIDGSGGGTRTPDPRIMIPAV